MNVPRLLPFCLLVLLPATGACHLYLEDADYDGALADEDCDDSDPSASPYAEEVCDGIDNDCDGRIDEDVKQSWWEDADGDGYGGRGGGIPSCEAPSGYVDNNEDCDDADAGINPGADEYCDGIDNDCDGLVDDDPVDGELWYPDEDGDGYGDEDRGERACSQPEGTIEQGGDCDDTDPEVNPDAEELCDGIDNDCDGDLDGDDSDVDPDATATWYRDSDGDGFGVEDDTVDQCSQPEGYVLTAGDCDDGDPQTHPDALDWNHDDTDADCDGYVDATVITAAPVVIASTDPYARAGIAVDFVGDVDGDGTDDLLVGAHRASSGTEQPGRAFLISGGALEPGGETVEMEQALAILEGSADGDRLGRSVARGGDPDGDGFQEVWVGAYMDSTRYEYGGAIYRFHGPLSGTVYSTDADVTLYGGVENGYAGLAAGHAGDFDGDGTGDLVVGAPGNDETASDAGTFYLVEGTVSGEQELEGARLVVRGEAEGDYLGYSVSTAGDFDGDGLADVIAGAPYADGTAHSSGAAYLFLGPISGAIPAGDASWVLWGRSAWDEAGLAVAGGGDLDGDGYDDVLVGAPASNQITNDDGVVYVLSGPEFGGADLEDAESRVVGVERDDRAGEAAAVLGDFDGDDQADLAVASPAYNAVDADEGGVFVFLGPISGTLSLDEADALLVGADGGDMDDVALAGGGDFDDDGFGDLLVGLPLEATITENAGAALLLPGADPP